MKYPSGSSRAVVGIGGVLVLLVAACLVALFPGSENSAAAPQRLPALLAIEHDGLRYTYHVPTGHGALFDLSADPRALSNLAHDRPELAAQLRAMLAAEHDVEDLESLRGEYRETIEALRGLGYL